MRPAPGTVAFTTAAALTLALATGAGVVLAMLLLVPGFADPLRTLPDNVWWFMYRDAPENGSGGAFWRIGAAIVVCLAVLPAAVRARRLQRQSSSSLPVFLTLFFFTLSVEGLRAASALLYARDGSIQLSIVCTRTVYWGRIAGLLSLLIAGLYCIEWRYRRHGILATVVLVTAFAVATAIPVDRTEFLAQLTWKLGDEQGIWFVNLIIGLLALATVTSATWVRHDRRYLWLALGFAFLLAGRELFCFALNPGPTAGGVAMIAIGGLVCLRTLSALYRPVTEPAPR